MARFTTETRRHGEERGRRVSVGFIVFVASLVGIVPLIAGAALLVSGQTVAGGALVLTGVVLLILVALISAALNTILLAALYLYAAEGTVPSHFNDAPLHDAFGSR